MKEHLQLAHRELTTLIQDWDTEQDSLKVIRLLLISQWIDEVSNLIDPQTN